MDPYSGGARAPGGSYNGGAQGQHGPEKGQKPGQGHKRTMVKGGVKKRAIRRSKAVGKIKGVSRKDGITKREAKKIRNVWTDKGKPRPWKKGNGKGQGKGKGKGNGKGQNQNAPLDLNAPLTRRTLSQQVGAAQDLRYGGELRQIDNEIRGSERRSTEEIPTWFQSFINTAQGAAQQSQAAWGAAQQNVLGAANQGYERAQGVNAQHLAGAQQDAAVRGTTADLQPYQQAEQAAQGRQAQGVGEAGFVGSLGAADTTNIAMQQVIGAQKMLEALNSEGRARGVLQGERRGLVRDRGQYGVETKQRLLDTEFQKSAVRKEFGLDVLSEQNDAADDAADNKNDRRQERRERRKDRWERRQDRAQNRLDRDKYNLSVRSEQRMRDKDLADDGRTNNSAGGGGGGGGSSIPPSERASNKRQFRSTVRKIAAGQLSPGEKNNLDPLLALAAQQMAGSRKKGGNGVHSKSVQRRLWREFGIRVPLYKKKTPGPHDIGATPSPLGPK